MYCSVIGMFLLGCFFPVWSIFFWSLEMFVPAQVFVAQPPVVIDDLSQYESAIGQLLVC